jgi:hypothetical protein
VTRLEYEAYAEMAEDVMAQLGRDLEAQYDLCAVSIHHRVGTLAIGEASVVIAVSAPHRQDALCRVQGRDRPPQGDRCRSGRRRSTRAARSGSAAAVVGPGCEPGPESS